MTETIIILIILVLLSGFFSGIEIAYFSLSAGKISAMVKKGLKEANTVQKLKSNPERLLVVILLGNNIVNILAASIATKLSLEIFDSNGVAIATGVLTLVILIFGEIFPKALAQAHAERLARASAKTILFLQFLLFPLVYLFEKTSLIAVRLSGNQDKLKIVPEEEISAMMHLGVKEGSVEKHEQIFVERVFKFTDANLKKITTPIEKVVMLDGGQPVEQIAFFAANSGYSRFPVFQNTKNNIVGKIHIKDIAKANNSDARTNKLLEIIQPITKISENESLDKAFNIMKRNNTHLAFVQNENNDLIGLVTLEDLLEELVGEIFDESDKIKTSVTT